MQKNKLITLWILLIIGMILHFNYHVGEMFYGVDVVKSEYKGVVPFSVFIIRFLFYILPIIWILILIYFSNIIIRLLLFIISLLYFIAHTVHLFGELNSEHIDPSQLALLTLMFFISGITSFEHYMHYKTK